MESVSCAFVPSLSLANKSYCADPLQAVRCSPVLGFYHFFSFLPIKTFLSFLLCINSSGAGSFGTKCGGFEEAYLFNLLRCFSAFCVSMSDRHRRRNGESRCCLWQTVGWEAPTHQQSYEGDKQTKTQRGEKTRQTKQTKNDKNTDGWPAWEIVSIRKFVSWTVLPYFQQQKWRNKFSWRGAFYIYLSSVWLQLVFHFDSGSWEE